MGGTGKTSAAVLVARQLQQAGVKPAIVLRGYRRQAGQPVVLTGDSGRARADIRTGGDEACMLTELLADVPVGVGKRREEVISKLAQQTDVQVVVLDDGFQYFRMKRVADIVLIDATDDLSRQRLVPAGYLREPLGHLRRAHHIWLTHTDLVEPETLLALRSKLRKIAESLPLVETRHQITGLRPVNQSQPVAAQLQQTQVLAVSAIGNPRSFEQSLRHCGAQVSALRYDDHHYYTDDDLREIDQIATDRHADFIAITAKDAVKWPNLALSVPVTVVECQLQITSGEHAVAELLQRAGQAADGAYHG